MQRLRTFPARTCRDAAPPGRLARSFVVAVAVHVALALVLGSLKLVEVWPRVAATFQLEAAPPPLADGPADPYAAYRDFEYRPAGPGAPAVLSAHVEMPVEDVAPPIVGVIGVWGDAPMARPMGDVSWRGPTDVLAGLRTGSGGGGGGTNTFGIGVAAQPDYLRNPPPTYPWVARRNGWEGTTVVRVDVMTNGAPAQVALVESSGYSVLDEAALAAVRQWKFRPARLGTLPVQSQVDVPVRFRLSATE